jgi:uncharacterized membrane protein YfcA
MHHFQASGVECSVWLPPVVAFFVALLTTPAGVSGAFLLLPFQVNVLGFAGPAVTPTNLIYNIVSVPGGVGRYIRDRRMLWPLAWTITAGTLPGVFAGALIRIHYLADPRYYKLFVGCVLLYLGARLFQDVVRPRSASRAPGGMEMKTLLVSRRKIGFEFQGGSYSFPPGTLAAVALLVGLIGGIYGVGGGAMIAPFLMTILRLPAYAVAGAALLGTLVTSVAGVVFFLLLGGSHGSAVRPDWALGLLFGAGGLLGSYAGALWQKRLPERAIRLFLAVLVTGLALSYTIQFFV